MKKQEVEVFTCAHCGGTMTYDIASQCLKCSYCESMQKSEEEQDVLEYAFSEVDTLEKESEWNDEVRVHICKNCGGEMVTNPYQMAFVCVYCGSSQVLESEQTAGIKPEGILPFKLEKYEVNPIVEKWFSRRYLAPNNLKVLYQSDHIQGVYVPYWTYDAKTHSTYHGQGGRYYYETREVNGKKETITKVRWYAVHGALERYFDDIIINGSKQFNDDIMSKIEPFNTINGLEHYTPEYLAGYTAQRYSYGVKECFTLAKQKMSSQLEEDARTDILKRYDTVRGVSVRTTFNQITYKHVLLPVYVASYDYNGNKYQFMINGETGKIAGTYPYSFVKLTILFLSGITLLVMFFYYFNQ